VLITGPIEKKTAKTRGLDGEEELRK